MKHQAWVVSVLVLDDCLLDLKRMKREVRGNRAVNLHPVSTVEQAREVYTQHHLDVAIIDVNLVGSPICGIAFARELREVRGPELQTAVISAVVEDLDETYVKNVAGADLFVPKPVTVAGVIAELAKVREARMQACDDKPRTLREVERDLIRDALVRAGGNKTVAARWVGRSRRWVQQQSRKLWPERRRVPRDP